MKDQTNLKFTETVGSLLLLLVWVLAVFLVALSSTAVMILAVTWIISLVTTLIAIPSATVFGWLTIAAITWLFGMVVNVLVIAMMGASK